jgi:hypothetical protein
VSGLFAALNISSSEGDRLPHRRRQCRRRHARRQRRRVGAISLELQGGLGADNFIGSAGNDRILGGDGNDFALMGAGDDEFIWNPGDDLDTLEGQAGIDTMDFNGNGAAENFTISPNGGRILFFRDVAAVTMDLNDVERINLDAGAGVDTFVINDLTGTDAQLVTLNLAGTIGGATADGSIDTITANGSAGADSAAISGAGGSITVAGLSYTLAINQSEAADRSSSPLAPAPTPSMLRRS